MDARVRLRGLRLRGRHGVGDAERAADQEFVVAIDCPTDVARAAATDDLADALDYTRLSAIAAAVIGGPPRDLLETLADEIATRVLAETGASSVRVAVEKVQPQGMPGPAMIEVVRSRGPAIAPVELHVPDFAAVRSFYGALGFAIEREERGDEGYLVLRRGSALLAFWPGSAKVTGHAYFSRFPADAPRGVGVEIVVAVPDLDELYDRARRAGCVVGALASRPWGLRDFRVADPFGYYIRFTEPAGAR